MATLHYLNAAKRYHEPEVPAVDNFYSVEFRVEQAEYMYQFKIWKSPSASFFVIVKQESEIMNWIRPGDVLPMTYYSDNTARPKQQLSTQILNIHRQDDGRFRGHYVISLGIVEN